jgi:hypothetical protein
MNTPVLTSDARRNVVLMLNHSLDGFKGKQSYSLGDSGQQILTLTDVPVFRSGTFRDSMGVQHTWEPLHMDQMALHYDLLAGRGIFANVPVRQGHPSFFGPDPILGLIGYHTGIRTEERVSPVDGQTYTYLLANYQIIDPTAAAKVEAGLYRSRSAEIGSFVGNNEAEYWPVYMGFAYVDIPAVEGLDSFSKTPGVGVSFSIMDSPDKEAPVSGAQNPPASPVPTPPATPPQTQPPAPTGTPVPEQVPDPEPRAGESGRTTEDDASRGEHARQGQSFVFTIAGRQTTDFAAVQAHVNALEETQREQVKFARESFVDELAQTGRITAPQLDSTKAFARGLNDEQYGAWQETWKVAPAVPLLGTHGRGSGVIGAPVASQTEVDEAYNIAKETVDHLRRSGMPQDKLEQTQAFKRMQQLQSQRPA